MADVSTPEVVTLKVSEGAAYGAALQAYWSWRLQQGESVKIEDITGEFVGTDSAETATPAERPAWRRIGSCRNAGRFVRGAARRVRKARSLQFAQSSKTNFRCFAEHARRSGRGQIVLQFLQLAIRLHAGFLRGRGFGGISATKFAGDVLIFTDSPAANAGPSTAYAATPRRKPRPRPVQRSRTSVLKTSAMILPPEFRRAPPPVREFVLRSRRVARGDAGRNSIPSVTLPRRAAIVLARNVRG